MSQAIVTRHLGPTDTRGDRVKATCRAGSVTLPWNYQESTFGNHRLAAMALVYKLAWFPSQGRGFAGLWVSGGLADGSTAWVFMAEHDLLRGFDAKDVE